MHQTCAEVIAELFGLIQDARRRVHEMVAPMKSGSKEEDEQRKRSIEAFNNAMDYFLKKRIYLAATTAEKVEELFTLMRTSIFDYDRARALQESEKWLAAWTRMGEELPPVISDDKPIH